MNLAGARPGTVHKAAVDPRADLVVEAQGIQPALQPVYDAAVVRLHEPKLPHSL